MSEKFIESDDAKKALGYMSSSFKKKKEEKKPDSSPESGGKGMFPALMNRIFSGATAAETITEEAKKLKQKSK